MTQIRTADEMLNEYHLINLLNDDDDKATVILAMQEYAKQFIDLAADEAEIMVVKHGTVLVSKESILKIKDLIK
jgi:hypothetical protein